MVPFTKSNRSIRSQRTTIGSVSSSSKTVATLTTRNQAKSQPSHALQEPKPRSSLSLSLSSSRWIMSLLVPQPTAVRVVVQQSLVERPTFVALAQQGRFDELAQVLISSTSEIESQEWLSSSMSSSSFKSGESPLHILLQYRPPLSLVNLLLQKMQLLTGNNSNSTTPPEAATDNQGRTPLHISCAFGCSVDVVARILNGATSHFVNPARVQDVAHMTPLHYACLAAGARRQDMDLTSLSNVISFLVQVHPNGVHVKNEAGMIPADFLTNGQDGKILRPILSQATLAKKTPKVVNIPMEICCEKDMSVMTDLDVPFVEKSDSSQGALMTTAAAASTPSSSHTRTTTASIVCKLKDVLDSRDLDNTETTEWDWCPF